MSPDQTSKSSYIKHFKTDGARFVRPMPYPHWYFLAFGGDSPEMDDDIDGACRPRQLPLQVSQNRLLRPDLVL